MARPFSSFPRLHTTPISRRAMLRAAGGCALGPLLASLAGRAVGAQEPSATPAPLGPAVPPELSTSAGDWPTPQGNLAGHRAATRTSIDSRNVTNLEAAWRFPIAASSGYGAVTATPIVAGETVYLQDMESNVFALDLATGDQRWQRRYGAPTAGGNGVAIGYGRVFAAIGLAAEVFALDAATGDELWRVKLSANPAEFIFMAPLVHDNVVYVGTSPGAYVGGTRGILFALDAGSGAVLWQWDTTVDNLWGNARLNSGGGVWQPPSIDDAGNLYFGTGNPAPWPESAEAPRGSTRPGDNLYSSSMVSLDPVRGALRWFVQAAAHDSLDHDFQLTPLLILVGTRTLAIGGGKTGTVIAADAATGEVAWTARVGDHTPLGSAQTLPAPSATPVTVAPGFFGGILTPMAYADRAIFAPVINLPFTYSDTTSDFDIADATGTMVALNAADGLVLWEAPAATFFSAGATVANDVVFGGGLDGVMRGFATGSGDELWHVQTGAGINACPAIAGDTLLVPAGGPMVTSTSPAPNARNELIAFRPRNGAAPATPRP